MILDLGNNPISVSLAYADGSGAIAVPISGFDLKDSHLGSDGLSKTTGTLTIPTSLIEAFPESLDPLENPARFARKCRIITTIKDSTGATVPHPRGRLRILKNATATVGRAPELTIEIGCLLAMKDLRKLPVDDSGVTLGTITTRTEIINRLAAKIGIGALIDPIDEYPINYPVATEESYVTTMGRLAWDAGYVLWIDNLEQLRARKMPIAATTPDLRIKIGTQEAKADSIPPDETPVEIVRASGVAPEVTLTQNPETVYAIAKDEEFDPSEVSTTTFLGFGTSQIITLTNTRQPKGRIFPTQFPGSASLIYAAEEDSFVYYDDEAEGLLRRRETIIRQPRGIVFPAESPGDTSLTDSKEIVTIYTYENDATIRVDVKTYEPAAIVLGTAPNYLGSRVRSYGMKLSAWDTERWIKKGRGWVQVSTARRYKPGETSRANPSYSNSGATTPPAPERRDEPNQGEEKQYKGQVKFPPIAGATPDEDDRDFDVGYPVSDAHCTDHARLEGTLLHGRQRRLNWILPLRDRILTQYQPFMVTDWTNPQGVVSRHILDGTAWVHAADRGVISGDSINLGQVKRLTPLVGAPPADGVNDPAEYVAPPYAESATLIGTVQATGSLFAPGYELETTANLSGTAEVTGILTEFLYLSGTVEVAGQLQEDEMRDSPLTIAPEGMVLTYVSATQLQITSGRVNYQVNGEARRAVAIASSNISKNINAAWTVGSGVGGRVGAALAANTTYHVFAIMTTTGVVDYMFDTSVTGANFPSGYASRRRIGSVMTDGSSNIRQFTQTGDVFRWTPALGYDFSGTVPTATNNLQAITVPTGLAVQPLLALDTSGTGITVFLGTPGLPLFQVNDLEATFNRDSILSSIYTNTSAQIGLYATGTPITYYITSMGWIDPLR